MARRMALVSMCLVLMLGGTAWGPKLVGPTPGAGYRFSLEVPDPIIWMGPGLFVGGVQFSQVAELIVRVQDAQGRPVDGVPVTFEVEPGWRGVDNLTVPLYSLSPTWHTRVVYAAPPERSARFSHSHLLMWSGHDALSHAESLQTSPVSW